MGTNTSSTKELASTLDELTSTTMGRRLFLQAAPLLFLYSCSSKNKKRFKEGDNSGQNISITPDDELKMTQEILPKIRQDYPLHDNNLLQNYIRDLGRKIISKNDLEKKPYSYEFSVVNVDYVNAFALPAGTIMITAPLISLAESEAELAGVIGHEIGHVKARHAAERIDKEKKEKSNSLLYMGVGGLLGGAAGIGLGKLLCKPKDKECLQRAAVLGAAAGVGGGFLIQKYAFLANSREDELEADRIGYRLAVAAGYHKDHVGDFYSKLYELENKANQNKENLISELSDAMSTHPPSIERVNQMKEMSSKSEILKSATISSKEFEKIRKIAQTSNKKG
jgi:predicted Zn-dependent protease